MITDETKEASTRATIHLNAWSSANRLRHTVSAARGTRYEQAARDAYSAIERLLDWLEADTARAGSPLVLPLRRDEAEEPLDDEAREGGWPESRPSVPAATRMTVEEFLAWQSDEPDSYELVDGAPVRLPGEKQGGRRIGWAFVAAELALGIEHAGTWITEPTAEFGGESPLAVAAQDWGRLEKIIKVLRGLAAMDDRAPHAGRTMDTRPGQSLDGLLQEARRMATIERDRT